MSNVNFKLYDPVADLIATGSGGLPLTGGTLIGSLVGTSLMQIAGGMVDYISIN